MATMKIKKDDMVQVIAGKDKGKSGKVVSVDKKNGTVVVEGINKYLSIASQAWLTSRAESSRWKPHLTSLM